MINAWRRSGNTKPIKYRQIFGAFIMAALLTGFVVKLIEDVSAENVRQDRVAQDQRIYDAQLQTFNDAVASRNLCLNSVQASLNNRAMWEITVSLLDDADLETASKVLAGGPLLAGPPRTESECGPMPTPPDIPASLVER